MNDINSQKPWTTNQVENTKPNVKRSLSSISGYFAGSMNGGHNKTITYKKIMAGEYHESYRIKTNIQMLTPITPAYQNLKITYRVYFVPNKRVWKNAEKYTAQNEVTGATKILERPNLFGKEIPFIMDPTLETGTLACNTTQWRDAFISSYIPRFGINDYAPETTVLTNSINKLPAIDALPLRGRVAIYNDMERNKELMEEMTEYDGDTVSDFEWQSYVPSLTNTSPKLRMRSKRQNSYYTNYTKSLQGFQLEQPTGEGNNDLISWATFESYIAEARSQAENQQANPWDVIAKIRGSKKLTEGKIQMIAEKTYNLNYSAITQNTYNANENIREEFQIMGKQGAYSYTELDIELYKDKMFIEEGYIHVIATVQADTVFESGIDRNLLNTKWEDEYRPDMAQRKEDVIYNAELGTQYTQAERDKLMQIIGYKRKYSELFKLPNVICGDLTSENYWQQEGNSGYTSPNEVITQKTFQFFETGESLFNEGGGITVSKKEGYDYTDLLINKNQAIKNTELVEGENTIVLGNNQIYFVGVANCIVDYPVEEEIKQNYTKWGEH